MQIYGNLCKIKLGKGKRMFTLWFYPKNIHSSVGEFKKFSNHNMPG